jgi:ceramide glucosyltransferase
MFALSLGLFALACLGLLLLTVQLIAVALFRRRSARSMSSARTPGISVLKPLCGVDDDLKRNLELFAQLDYPDYEVMLGVRNVRDAAFPIATEMVSRWPKRFRLVIQQGEPGLNPKVNQLITLAREAKHDLLVVSDSNVRVRSDYLTEIAALFEDKSIGLVTHAVAGVGEQRIGALMDNLYMTTHVSAGVIAAKVVAGQDLVVGKSMAFRRSDLAAMGGFESAKYVLAEDYTMGRRIASELGKRVCVASQPVLNVTQRRSVSEFIRRYQRWSVMQRQAVGYAVYASKALMNPFPTALVAFLCAPSLVTFAVVCGVAVLKSTVDAIAFSVLRRERVSPIALLVGPLCDLLVAGTWVHGLLNDRVNWRGNVLKVTAGTQLVPMRSELLPRPTKVDAAIKLAA